MSLGLNISTCNEINSMLGKPSIDNFVALKGQRKIVCLTAYSASMAKVLDPHCDLLLVGDSVGMVVYGMDNTQNVDLNTMIRHGQAVMRRRKSALVVIDMPSGSYEASPEQALVSANEIMTKTGADAVKLEGGADFAPHVKCIVESGIPVLGHIGLLPQRTVAGKNFRITGRTSDEISQLHIDSDALADAGVFGIVMEGIVEPVAASIAKSSKVLTIGIGASAACDGQILVTDDMLGLYDKINPKFVKRYLSLSDTIRKAVSEYVNDVENEAFPTEENSYHVEVQT